MIAALYVEKGGVYLLAQHGAKRHNRGAVSDYMGRDVEA